MWDNPTLFYWAKSIEKYQSILTKDQYWQKLSNRNYKKILTKSIKQSSLIDLLITNNIQFTVTR